jgi:hypothetical protein
MTRAERRASYAKPMKRNDLTNRHPILSFTLTVIAISALAGCAGVRTDGANPSPQSSDRPSATPSSSTNTDTGVRDDLIVTRFSATATANTGETAHVVETVYAPHKITPAERKMLTTAPCPDWESVSPDGVGLPVRLTTTEVSGSWPKYHFIAVRSDYSSTSHAYTASAWNGAWDGLMASCTDGIALIPGQASGIVMIDPHKSADDDSWGKGTWGLTAEFGEDRPLKVKLSACSIEIGPAATASPHLAAMTTADATHGCVLGWNE